MGFHKFCQGSMGSARVWYLYGLHSRVGNLQHFLRYYNDASKSQRLTFTMFGALLLLLLHVVDALSV